jgi:hypothetical protein
VLAEVPLVAVVLVLPGAPLVGVVQVPEKLGLKAQPQPCVLPAERVAENMPAVGQGASLVVLAQLPEDGVALEKRGDAFSQEGNFTDELEEEVSAWPAGRECTPSGRVAVEE